MSRRSNPALSAFLAQLADEIVVAQVVVRREANGFEVRHIADRSAPPNSLTPVHLHNLRQIVAFTAQGAFRPLKSAPNLQSGWRLELKDESELELALNQIYPGALPDWYAVHTGSAIVTPLHEFTQRQTGMYRITDKLSAAQAQRVIRTVCAPRFCLKQRLWPGPEMPIDTPEAKSLVPCLEPCAIFLEFARKAMRIEQESPIELPTCRTELETLIAALESAQQTVSGRREADLDDPLNARRVEWLLQKLREALPHPSESSAPD